jgi:hypothetical protein
MIPVAHLESVGLDWPLVVALCVAGLGSAVLTGAALVVFKRRRRRPYLLVALALAALLARTVVAALSLHGSLPAQSHHLLEHSLDVVMAGLVIAAVYYARSVAPDPTGGRSQ